MVKPLHAGLAARDGVLAASLARAGMTASALAIDGPQGFLHAMDSAGDDLEREAADLGSRWEILDTGITVKLYPSCAATHPPLDAILALRRREGSRRTRSSGVVVDVDRNHADGAHLRPAGDRARGQVQHGVLRRGRRGRWPRRHRHVRGTARMRDARMLAQMARVDDDGRSGAWRRRAAADAGARAVHLRDGRVVSQSANGARGYPGAAGERRRNGCEVSGLCVAVDFAGVRRAGAGLASRLRGDPRRPPTHCAVLQASKRASHEGAKARRKDFKGLAFIFVLSCLRG